MATRSMPTLSHEAALIAAAAAEEKAKELGIDVNIALVDAALYLLHFTRMDGAKLTSVDTAINKAFTAAGHRAATADLGVNPAFVPGGQAYSITNSNGGRFTLLGGGLPIEIGGCVVGAIGISSGKPEEDIACAEAGIKAILAFQEERGQ